jgi:DNA transposition AAA+ family ATPase
MTGAVAAGPRHFLALEGARLVHTEELRLVRRLVEDSQERLAMAAVTGAAGLGKSFALAAALTDAASLPVISLEFPARSSQRYIARRILKQLTGVDESGSAFVLTERAIEELALEERILAVDEAQRLGGHLIEYMRLLHDHPESRFALILTGGDRCWEVLSREPMLRSRIYRRVVFSPWTLERVLEIIPAYHPIYSGAEPELLAFVDDHVGHGNFRNWAAFTLTAAQICTDNGLDVLTEKVARNAFALLSGGAERRARGGNRQ